MIKYISKRFLAMFITVLLISFFVYFIIQLPPGDYVSSYISRMQLEGEVVDHMVIEQLRADLGVEPTDNTTQMLIASGLPKDYFEIEIQYPGDDKSLSGTLPTVVVTILKDINVDSIPVGGTNIEKALDVAINAFKEANGRTFPTWTDVLEVVRKLGYRKTLPSELNLNNKAEDWTEAADSDSGVN